MDVMHGRGRLFVDRCYQLASRRPLSYLRPWLMRVNSYWSFLRRIFELLAGVHVFDHITTGSSFLSDLVW